MSFVKSEHYFVGLVVLTIAVFYTSIHTVFSQVTSCENCTSYGYCLVAGVNGTCSDCRCPAGFTGACCETPPDPGCITDPCPTGNFQACQNLPAGQRACNCDAGWTGTNCDNEIDPCDPDPCGIGADECFPNGTKNAFNCECNNGYSGYRCENFTCKPWESSQCVCNSTLCKNGGTCAYNGPNSYQCFCPPNYDGSNCQYHNKCLNQSTNPCQHGGVCTYNGNNQYSCDCLDIWTGPTCQYYDACNPSPCYNGATCNNVGNNFTCSCVHGYNGTLCRSIINNCSPNPCKNGGTCTNLIGDYNCTCQCGAYGKSCQNREDFCHDSNGNNYCQTKDSGAVCNNGFCDFSCTCSADWTDTNCTMMMIVWNVIKEFEGAEVDLEEMLTEIVLNPVLIKDLVPFMLAQLPLENQTALSWDYDDLFVWASYERTELSSNDIVQWYQTSMGNCFTFNHQNSSKQYNLRYSGDWGGFKALMRVRQDEYLAWVDTAALLVFVYPQGESIMGESVQYQAGPGEETTLFVAKTSYSRLGKPYGVCVKDISEVVSYYYTGNYTVDGCFRSCYQDAVQQACGCMDPRYPIPNWAIPCDLGTRNCVLNVTTVLGDPSTWQSCVCPQPCNEDIYDVSWTSTIFRSFPLQCGSMTGSAQANCTTNDEDMAMISVSFPNLVMNTVMETPKMSFNDVITRLGSYLGLLLGFSICTLVEFGFLAYRIFMAFCTKKKIIHNNYNEKFQ